MHTHKPRHCIALPGVISDINHLHLSLPGWRGQFPKALCIHDTMGPLPSSVTGEMPMLELERTWVLHEWELGVRVLHEWCTELPQSIFLNWCVYGL